MARALSWAARPAVTWGLVAALLALGAGPAGAGGFTVAPVRVELNAQKPTAALVIRNENEEPVIVQLQCVAWAQDSGLDVYTDSMELLATPPLFTIPGGGSQIVRVGLRRPADAQRELSYRLFLTEVPGPPKAEAAGGTGGTGLQIVLRIGVPVFVKANPALAPDLQWTVLQAPDGSHRVRLQNRGNAHTQVSDIRLYAPGSAQLLASQPAPAYLLPGQAREWPLQPEPDQRLGAGPVQLRAYSDSGAVEAQLTPQRLPQ